MRNVSLAIALLSLAGCTHEDDPSARLIRINEVVPRGRGSDGWMELYNPAASTLELGGWTVTTADVLRGFTLPADATILPHGFLVIAEASFPAGLGATDTVHLFSRSGVQVDAFSWSQIRDTGYGRCPEGSGDFLILEATEGAPNACPP